VGTLIGNGSGDGGKDTYEGGMTGTQNVIDAINRSGTVKRLIYTSSMAAVFNRTKGAGHEWTETDWASDGHDTSSEAWQNNWYGRSKVDTEHLVNKAAAASGVKSICMVPFQAGVLEFGAASAWAEMPAPPALPTAAMREAFEDLGAKYAMLWSEKGGEFSVAADYKIPERVAALRAKRGDDKSYITESRAMKFPAAGDAYVAAAARGGESLFCQKAATDEKLERRELAKEFSVSSINFVPVEGGVLECGIPTEAKLNGNTLAAALKMRCDTSGAGYSAYWTQEEGEYVIAGTYVTPACEAELRAAGRSGSFPEASQGLRLPAAGGSPVATVGSTLRPFFVPQASAEETMGRGALAADYGVESICMKATEGGVIEFGTAKGSTSWAAMPDVPDLPKAEMKKAFDDIGAVYMCFWQKQGETYFITGGFELPERRRALKGYRGDEETFPVFQQLDASGKLRAGVSLPFSMEEAVRMYELMVTSSTYDTVLQTMQRQGRISFYCTNWGEEATGVGTAAARRQTPPFPFVILFSVSFRVVWGWTAWLWWGLLGLGIFLGSLARRPNRGRGWRRWCR